MEVENTASPFFLHYEPSRGMQRFCVGIVLSISKRPCVVSSMPRVKEHGDSSDAESLAGDEEEESSQLDEEDARGTAHGAIENDEETVAVAETLMELDGGRRVPFGCSGPPLLPWLLPPVDPPGWTPDPSRRGALVARSRGAGFADVSHLARRFLSVCAHCDHRPWWWLPLTAWRWPWWSAMKWLP